MANTTLLWERGRFFLRSLSLVLLLGFSLSLPGGNAYAVHAEPPCVVEPSWRVVPGIAVGDYEDVVFEDVSIVGERDIWAAGYHSGFNAFEQHTLVAHWDGVRWTRVPSPNPNSYPPFNRLYAIDAVSATDIWAVGTYMQRSTDTLQTLILHWDGTRWELVDSPNVGSGHNGLSGVAAVSASNVLAVGYYRSNDRTHVLSMRWDGVRWSVTTTPVIAETNAALSDISALPNGEVWAVGSASDETRRKTFAMVWNGSQWNVTPTPVVGTGSGFESVVAIGPDDVWAVGSYSDGSSGSRTLTMHWNGAQWERIASPSPGVASTKLDSVDGNSSANVWAVGSRESYGEIYSVAMRWNGNEWRLSTTLNPGMLNNMFYGVSVERDGTAWAVGDGPRGGLVERHSDSFIDVPPGSTFYPSVQCLVCQGIVTADESAYFEPNVPITRQLLVRMVARAAGFFEPVQTETFEDIDLHDYDHDHIERMALRGLIGGYPCGGPGEPCVAPQNRPYFRPNATATRGQIAKIIANAAGYIEAASDQTFQDVSPTNPFYVWVERLAQRGIIGGYPCGNVSVGEPCVAFQSPYFRPNNVVTRGQTAKIVANTFFPGSQAP